MALTDLFVTLGAVGLMAGFGLDPVTLDGAVERLSAEGRTHAWQQRERRPNRRLR